MKKPKQEDYDDDDCEICKLMRTGNVSREELVKAINLQNFSHLTFSHSQECENVV